MLTSTDIRLMLAEGESDSVELKTDVHDPRSLARHIAAFANGDGGVIIVGVDEHSRSARGTDIGRITDILRRALDQTRPEPHAIISAVEIDGRQVAVIEIEASSRAPVLSNGAAYRRVGSDTRPMTPGDVKNQIARSDAPVHDKLDQLAESVAAQTALIDKLTFELQRSGQWTTRMREWLISGVIGAILGQLVAMMFS